jgi:hypothetical protein
MRQMPLCWVNHLREAALLAETFIREFSDEKAARRAQQLDLSQQLRSSQATPC